MRPVNCRIVRTELRAIQFGSRAATADCHECKNESFVLARDWHDTVKFLPARFDVEVLVNEGSGARRLDSQGLQV